jgi:hypothetical protein
MNATTTHCTCSRTIRKSASRSKRCAGTRGMDLSLEKACVRTDDHVVPLGVAERAQCLNEDSCTVARQMRVTFLLPVCVVVPSFFNMNAIVSDGKHGCYELTNSHRFLAAARRIHGAYNECENLEGEVRSDGKGADSQIVTHRRR